MRKFLGAVILSLKVASGYSQIVDDSTELVYGPKTTKFTYESSILNNDSVYTFMDTSLYFFERKSIVDRKARKIQNLGSFGTALFPVFYDPPAIVGRTSGFNAYRPYFRGSKDIKVYDTKSPLIDLMVYLGGNNRNLIEVDFSRNVRKNWNLGFDIHTITTDKQLANEGKADRQIVGTSFDLYTHYKHQKELYQALLYFSNTSHKVVELGGVRYGEDSLTSELFQFNNALLRLEDAESTISHKRWHLYHDYQVAEQFQWYHILDYSKEQNTYQDYVDQASDDYDTYRDAYDQFLISEDSTDEKSTFSSFSNEIGIKGDVSKAFYRAYIKLRNVDFGYSRKDPVSQKTELYVGGYVRLNWNKKFNLLSEGALLQGGEYRLTGILSSKVINISYETMRYHVPFIYNHYSGNHYEWANDFTPAFVNRISGDMQLEYKAFTFIPKAVFSAYNHFLYFDESQIPKQASSGILSTSIGGEIHLKLSNTKGEGLHLENEVMATNISGGAADFMRIPELFYNGRYYWRGLMAGDLIPIEIGIDAHARSSYFANAFNPVTQQFYLQNELETSGYYKADLFFNMRLDKFYFGFKWVHIDQPSDGGYFATPYYPGQPRTIDLMIRWRFYD